MSSKALVFVGNNEKSYSTFTISVNCQLERLVMAILPMKT